MAKPGCNHVRVHWYDGRLVGHMIRRGGPLYFVYDESWLGTGHNLSPISLPFTDIAFNGTHGVDGLPGILADCLPDKWGRKVAAREFRSRQWGEPDQLGLLLWRGDRGLGALRFAPGLSLGGADGLDPNNPVYLAALAKGAALIERDEPGEVLPILSRAAGTAGGALPKVVVQIYPDQTIAVHPPSAGSVAAIVKLDLSPSNTQSPCEHAYLQMAKLAKINAVDSWLLDEPKGGGQAPVRHLAVRRFDIPDQADPSHRYHVHALSSLFHKDSSELDYSDFLKAAVKLTLPLDALEEIIRRMVFNVLASNTDDHGKNHAFLYNAQTRAWGLAPAYDLTFQTSYLSRGMHISGEVWPSIDVMRKLADTGGIRASKFASIVNEVVAALDCWQSLAEQYAIPREQAAAVQDAIGRMKAQTGASL